jgi:hypothetical protein
VFCAHQLALRMLAVLQYEPRVARWSAVPPRQLRQVAQD